MERKDHLNMSIDLRSITTNEKNIHHQFIDYLKVLAFSTVVIAHQFGIERDAFFKKEFFDIRLFRPIQVFLTNGGEVLRFFSLSQGT